MTTTRNPRVTITLSNKERLELEALRVSPNEELATIAKRFLGYGTELGRINSEVQNAVNTMAAGFEDLKLRIRKLRSGELVSSILNTESEKLLTRLNREQVAVLEKIFIDIATGIKDLATRIVGGLESIESSLTRITKNQETFNKTLTTFSFGLQDLSDRLLTRSHS